jgi:periplasmic protein TonB
MEPEIKQEEFKLDSLTGTALEEVPIWRDLYENLRDTLFPKRLPPLKLTSKPIAVKDPMAFKRSPTSSLVSFIVHAVVIALIALFLASQLRQRIVQKPTQVANVDIKPFIPVTPKGNKPMGGGGGGGSHDLVDVSKGRLPKLSKEQITPPQIIKNDHPKLPVEPTVVVPPIKLPDSNVPDLGMPQSQQVQLASNGTGTGGGMGTGSHGGLGSGNGAGVGPGEGGGYGGGVYRIGNGVSAPQLIHAVDPEFSDEARRAKYQGVCLVSLIVDAQGHPQNIHIIRKLGMGLDEKAEEAVRQYLFKPAYFQGKAVPVQISVEVNFRIY